MLRARDRQTWASEREWGQTERKIDRQTVTAQRQRQTHREAGARGWGGRQRERERDRQTETEDVKQKQITRQSFLLKLFD